MERSYDFVKRLDRDVSLKILMCLDDPKDVAKLEAVSKVWLKFVVENELQKKLCLKLCPEVSKIVDVGFIDEDWYRMPELLIPEYLVREHRVPVKDESLEDGDYSDVEEEIRYWSDEGTSDPTAPAIMVYEMFHKLGVISEILLKPHLSCGSIFPAKAVRFSMGYRRPPLRPGRRTRYKHLPDYDDDMFIWTYTSPEFPMAQEYELQRFRLGRPVLCMGGILKVELLGRTNKNLDGLASLDDIKVFGQSLVQDFEIVRTNSVGNCILKCDVTSADYLKFYPSPMTDETFRAAHFEELIEYL